MTSVHYADTELRCPHCLVNGCKQRLLDALEAFRAIAGKPVLINSAYRCAVHNKAVGGAPRSQHVQGIAADIYVKGMTAAQLEAVARQVLAIKGIGRADFQSYLHLDLRKTRAEWCYGKDGKQVAYYPPKVTA